MVGSAEPAALADYAQRDETRREHQLELLSRAHHPDRGRPLAARRRCPESLSGVYASTVRPLAYDIAQIGKSPKKLTSFCREALTLCNRFPHQIFLIGREARPLVQLVRS